MSKDLKQLLWFSLALLILSAAYFVYAYTLHPPSEHRETFLNEVGEVIGEIALWGMYIIYGRTLLKLLLGKGALAKRLIPNYQAPEFTSVADKGMRWLDKTHIHVGVLTVVITVLHIALMGWDSLISNLFFVAMFALIIWQTLFGFIIRIKISPREVKKFSYSVHAQLFTGVMIAVFGWLGHALIGD